MYQGKVIPNASIFIKTQLQGIAGRSYDKETKQWHVPFEQKLKLETAFRVNRIKFECDGLAIRMANG